jgi:hypothetical protein
MSEMVRGEAMTSTAMLPARRGSTTAMEPSHLFPPSM